MMVNIIEQQAAVVWSVELNATVSIMMQKLRGRQSSNQTSSALVQTFAKPFVHPNGRVVFVPYGWQLMALATQDAKQVGAGPPQSPPRNLMSHH